MGSLSMPGLPVHHQLPEFTQTHVHQVSDAYQMVVFYSPSDIKSLLENFPEFKQDNLKIATFGPATAKAVNEAGLEAIINAPTPQAPSIAKALQLYFDEK